VKHILIFGAGRSSWFLINYLINEAEKSNWKITIVERNKDNEILQSLKSNVLEIVYGDVSNPKEIEPLLVDKSAVVSLLPPSLHIIIAEMCIDKKAHFFTASYVNDEMQKLSERVEASNLLFLNELGLDPGIDHMSAMRVIDRVREEGGEFLGFESFCGGLVAPESDNNPWNYKITWSPRNVVVAGQGVVKFKQENQFKYIPYYRLFRRTERLVVPGLGEFEAYPNRDSLDYINPYNFASIPTIFRGTLRKPGFCRAWDCMVQLGLTDDSYIIEGSRNMTIRDFTNSFLFYHPTDSVELKTAFYLKLDRDSDEIMKLQWLGLFDSTPLNLEKDASPAQILQLIIEDKWKLEKTDKDMVVMLHLFDYMMNGVKKRIKSYMYVKGEDSIKTAMAKTVGLPLAIAVKLFLQGKIRSTGVLIPNFKEVYDPILDELETLGIVFTENEEKL
jgi:saccharopine dehydrogenase-like NADP-dependent oxidoreductase